MYLKRLNKDIISNTTNVVLLYTLHQHKNHHCVMLFNTSCERECVLKSCGLSGKHKLTCDTAVLLVIKCWQRSSSHLSTLDPHKNETNDLNVYGQVHTQS